MLRIGTQSEKDSVEKELLELRERLANVDGLKRRRDEIDAELNKVWVEKPGQPSELSLAASDKRNPTG
jgi:ATP-binding cassette, subfamily D (ALD), peroxisomal long-chain fatty acid import protein